MGRHRRWSLLVGSVTAAMLLWPVPAPGAAAAGAQSPVVHPASYVPLRGAVRHAPFDTVFNNLDYNGGPVMPSNTDYLVFWSPGGLGAYGSSSVPEYVSGLERFFGDLAHDSGGHQNADSVAAQYNDSTGAVARYAVTFGGGVLDTDPYPTSQCPVNRPVVTCLTDAQIQKELEHFVAANGFKADLSHEYFVLTPPHVESCFTSNPNSTPPYGGCSAGERPSNLALYCAYHGNTTHSPMIIFSNDPYVTGIQGCDDGNHPNGPSDGALVGGLSHEHNESITDPVPNDAWTNGAGFNHGQENGDQCVGFTGAALGQAPNGAFYNQLINGHFYWYQMEWSNQGHECLQRLTPAATKPTAQVTVTSGSGLTMTFDATGSTAPGGVADYVWQFNDSFGDSTIEQSTPTITHTFPAAGAYSIGLTIFAHSGLSTGTGGIVTTGHSGFSPGFTSSPANPSAGQTVNFSGLTTVSNRAVKTYLWEFGDGSTGSGATPQHTYANPGVYTVTLVMFSGVGSAWPGAGAGPIVTAKIRVD